MVRLILLFALMALSLFGQAFPVSSGGGSGSPATTAAGCVQYNSSGSFACNSGFVAGAGVTQGVSILSYTASAGDQAQVETVNATYSGSSGNIPTLAGFYGVTTYNATGGTATHVFNTVGQIHDGSTGANVAPGLAANHFGYIAKTGTSTNGGYANFNAEGFSQSGAASGTMYAAFNLNGPPTISAGTAYGFYGLKIGYTWSGAATENVGVEIGGFGCSPSATWRPLVTCSGEAYFGGSVNIATTLNVTGASTMGAINGTTIPSSKTLLTKIASGAKALGTTAVASGACSSAVTDTATGALSTDTVTATFNGDPTGVTGYAPSTNGGLYIVAYPTADTVNFKYCNDTASSITPGAITLNWLVAR